MRMGGLDSITSNGDGTANVVCQDALYANRSHVFNITADQAFRLMSWALGDRSECLQDVLPDLTDDQRELILTGIPADTWDTMFGDDDEE